MTFSVKATDRQQVNSVTPDAGTAATSASSASELLPLPASTGDDLMTALAMLTVKQKHQDRVAADAQRIAGEKAQEEAQSRKIDKMRELANDTWTQGLVEGVLEGASAIASGASALDDFAASKQSCALESAKLARDAKLLDAGSKGLMAASHLGSAFAKSAQEEDRRDMAIADRDVDRAKSTVDGASTASRRAEDDIRETLNAVRQYLAAKTQLANAAIIKG